MREILGENLHRGALQESCANRTPEYYGGTKESHQGDAGMRSPALPSLTRRASRDWKPDASARESCSPTALRPAAALLSCRRNTELQVHPELIPESDGHVLRLQ